MTSTLILETLASEFSVDVDAVRRILEMLDGGLNPAHIGHHRRADTGATPEHLVRRMGKRHADLVELDRRRASIRRMLEGTEGVPAKVFDELDRTTDRFVLEDLFLPFRKPEPEVQLALDRGLGALADRLIAPSERARAEREEPTSGEPDAEAAGDGDAGDPAEAAAEEATPQVPDEAQGPGEEPAVEATAAELPVPEASEADGSSELQEPSAAEAAQDVDLQPGGDEASSSQGEPQPAAPADGESDADAKPVAGSAQDIANLRHHLPQVELTPELARVCSEFVAPDRGVHTDEEALNGAMRILADRLGRSSALRGQVRRLLRRHGVLSVQPGSNTERANRYKSLFKVSQPLKQLQGHRLITIRQGQRDRAITANIELDPRRALAPVRKALARKNDPDFDGVLDAVAAVALEQRLLPMLEADVRLELKERGDEEALRFIAAYLREVLLTAPLGPRPVAGVDVSPKQDWTVVVLDAAGQPTGEEVRIETGDKDDVTLAEELVAAVRDTGVEWLACSAARSVRPSVRRLRKLVELTGSQATVALVNDVGVTGWVNGEAGRKSLPERSVQARTAIAMGRRLQDPMAALLELDPRQLGLGVEKSLVSKANLQRVLDETVESCVALVGVDVNHAPEHLLARVPGLDTGAVNAIVAARAEAPFESREALRERNVLNPAQWQNAVGFLRVRDAAQRLDASALHPDQYALAMRLVEATGQPTEEVIGRFGGLKGLRRADFDVDEYTWRDLLREIGHPGRDPRPRLFPARPLPSDTDPASLEAGQVVEGFVCNVANFGAFVDIGLEREGFIHISALAQRFVRDARELTSVGRTVRAKIVDTSGSRIGLTLVDVPEREKPKPGRRRGEGRGERGRGRGERQGGRWSEPERQIRVARVRRDGMPGEGDRGGRRGGPGGPGRGGPGGGRRGDRRPPRDGGDRDAANFARSQSREPLKNNPFAQFFDRGAEGEQGS